MREAQLASLSVSVIGLGCNNFGRALDQAGSDAVVSAALDLGINFFDTASNYGEGRSESILGTALGSHRDEVVIATMFGMGVPGHNDLSGGGPASIHRSVERSLAELGTDRIDLLQLHKPDPDVPIAETLGALAELVERGIALEVGCSNLDAVQLDEAMRTSSESGSPRFVSNQVEYSLVNLAPESEGLADVAQRESVALLPFYPLASGLLTGKKRKGQAVEGRLNMDRYQRFLTDSNHALVEEIRSFAADRDLTMVQVALGWLLAQPTVPSVTPGATTPEQVRSNAAAAQWIPETVDLQRIDAIVREGG